MKYIHAAYFTCSDHFNELLVAVKSLVGVHEGMVKSIYAYCSKTDPFTPEQKQKLENLGVMCRETVHTMSWGGEYTVLNLLSGFKEISEAIDPDDYIMNIDSDTIFLSSKVLKDAVSSTEDFLGEKTINVYINPYNPSEKSKPFVYLHGSCFFVKGSLAKKMLQVYIDNKDSIFGTIKTLTYTEDCFVPPDHQVNLTAIKCKATIKTLGKINVPRDQSILHMELTKDDHWINIMKLLDIKTGSHQIRRADNLGNTTIIISDGRCGTSLMGLSLWQHPQITFLDEPFNCAYIATRPELFPEKLHTVAIKHFGSVEGMYSHCPNSWYGHATNQNRLIPFFDDVCKIGNLFKIHYCHCPPSHYGFWKYVTRLDNVRFIHVKRANKFNMFVSRLVSNKSNIWHISPTQNGIKDKPFSVDPQAFMEFFSYLEMNETFFDKILPSDKTMNLSFEEITRQFDTTMKNVQTFMGLDPISLEKAAAKRTITPYKDLVLNYEELKTYFTNTKWAKYFT